MFSKTRKNISTLSDDSLISVYKKEGESSIVGELYHRYMHLVYGICLKYLKDREESQDAVMQIFEKLIVLLRTHEIENFKSWLYTTTKNHCLMRLRTMKKEISVDLSEVVMEMNPSMHLNTETEEKLELEANIDQLEMCIKQLQVDQQHCITLFYLKKKSYKEISDETSNALKQVKSFIQNGKRNLKLCLEKNE